MITITTEGIEDLLGGLSGMQRQIPYAVANGLNVTGRRVKKGLYYGMRQFFDRPTPFTLNSLQMTPAQAPKGPLEVEVWFKNHSDPWGNKDHFLLPQVEGGKRPMKAFEMGMGGRFVVPGKGTKLDQYGNLGRGQITKLLSLSGGFREMGFVMNARAAAKQKQYFRLTSRKGKLLPGIYERVVGDEAGARAGRFLLARALAKKSKTKGMLKEVKDRTKALLPRGAQPVVLFTSQPKYAKRFDFYGIAQDVIDRNVVRDMSRAIDAEIAREMAYRARKGSL